MEKILLAFDATQTNSQALDFACYPGALTNAETTCLRFGASTRTQIRI